MSLRREYDSCRRLICVRYPYDSKLFIIYIIFIVIYRLLLYNKQK